LLAAAVRVPQWTDDAVYAAWAQERIADGKAETLSQTDISGTEWPLFGSVFYLWSVENLQAAWDAGDHRAGVEPRVFSKTAIIAASDLVIDPRHASWVKQHWGTNYLHTENVFYRMLVIASLTSREQLLHDGAHVDMLRDQVETFSQELDSSTTGLLDDYPGECCPGDVMAAIMCIKRADVVLGTDHEAFIKRSLRTFAGKNLDQHGLVPYSADAKTGHPLTASRGCGNSYVCLSSPELWPTQAKIWFEAYDRSFWQDKYGIAGFREHAKEVPHRDWLMDVDAGPVITGQGVAASAFGVGAARKNGRYDRGYPLTAEMIATVWELPNGILAVPRLLSNLSDAPMLGEAGILWQLTIQPQKGFPVKTGGGIPTYVYFLLGSVFLFGLWRCGTAILTYKLASCSPELAVWNPPLQTTLWACLLGGALAILWTHLWWAGLILLMAAVFLPITHKVKPQQRISESAAPETPGPIAAK
jgi:hypothetical protein